MGSVHTKEYRNKLEFGCANKRWYTEEELKALPEDVGLAEGAIGFHITGAFDKVYPIEKCWLMDDLCNEIRKDIRDYALSTGMKFYDIRAHELDAVLGRCGACHGVRRRPGPSA